MSHAGLRAEIAALGSWYHNVELAPGVWTNPAMGDYPRSRWALIEPYIPADLRGKSVLDLSCNSGYFSAQMKKRGASRVVGVDRRARNIRQAELVTRMLGVDIELVHDEVHGYCWKTTDRFDYVLFLGLFYHLRAPLFVLDRVALMVRERLYFQTVVRGDEHPTPPLEAIDDDVDLENDAVYRRPEFPKAFFIERKAAGNSANWWFANTACVRAMLRSAGFVRFHQVSPDTYVCEAPSDLASVPTYGTLWP